jgi:4-diphosphocytidyl-2C-methyl-D-erythritol kinase
LLALNRLWNLNFPRATLAKIGLGLGADVPVFIQGLPSWASGIGEKLEPTKLWPGLYYVVLVPDTQVPTSAIFSAPELTRNTKPLRIEGSLFEESLLLETMHLPVTKSRVLNAKPSVKTDSSETDSKSVLVGNERALNANAGASSSATSNAQVVKFLALKNDLQSVAVTRFPKVAGALAVLKAASAGHHSANMVVPPRMTGSGACVFAGFSSEDTALAVAEKATLAAEANTFIKVARSLRQHPLREWSFSV